MVAEETGHQEIELGPELAQVVLHGGAGETEPVIGVEDAHDGGGLGFGVLDGLGLIQDQAVEGQVLEPILVPGEQGVGGQDQVVVGDGLEKVVAVGAVKDQGA